MVNLQSSELTARTAGHSGSHLQPQHSGVNLCHFLFKVLFYLYVY